MTGRAAVLALCFALAVPRALHAHPGTGIVVDRAGNVYFVVLGRSGFMRLSPDGRASPFVTDERLRYPHHLVRGANGAIYAASDHDGMVWRADGNGAIAPHFSSTAFSRRRSAPGLGVGMGGDPFAMDAQGRIYALAVPGGSALVRIGPDTAFVPLARAPGMGWLHFSGMAVGADDGVYVSDAGRIWRVTADTAVVIANTGLDRAAGLAPDGAGNLIVAGSRDGRIARFDSTGAENTPASFRRLRLRYPTGVAVAGDDLYVLDASPGATAIWRLRGDDAERLYVLREPAYWLRRLAGLAPVALIVLLVMRAVRRRRATRAAA